MDMPVYLLKVSLCSGMFYLFYFLVLSRFTFFGLNRFYLLFSLLSSLIIPVLEIPVSEAQPVIGVVRNLVPQELSVGSSGKHDAGDGPVLATTSIRISPFDWTGYLMGFYYCITSFLGIRMIFAIGILTKRLQEYRKEKIGAVQVVIDHPKMKNGSFLNYIFIHRSGHTKTEVQQIFDHELTHVHKYHSVDRIFVKVIQVLLWFNPFIYLFARAIEENHEFEADREVGKSADKQLYANLLLQLSITGQGQFYHSFSKVPLQKRIVMLFNQPTPNMKKVMYVLIVPIVLISCLAFARFENKEASDSYRLVTEANMQKDTPKYRQKVMMTPEERSTREKTARKRELMLSDQGFQKKLKLIQELKDKSITVKVSDFYINKRTGRKEGYIVDYQHESIIVNSGISGNKDFNTMFSIGDELTFTVALAGIENFQSVTLVPEYLNRENGKLLVMSKNPAKLHPFLYEANKVRFADGTIAGIRKFANGKLQSADVKTEEGTVLTVNFKAGDPDLSTFKTGDAVRFRFVHEQKVADQNYLINDWVCISKDSKDYGVKNPDFFNKFYEKI